MSTVILDRVRSIAADILQVDDARLSAEASPESVESWDSVQNLNLMLALEQEFGLQFEPEEMDRMKNIGQIAAVVSARRGG